MGERGNELARGRIPELGVLIGACSQYPSTVGTERCPSDGILMDKGGNELPRDRIPELGGFVCAPRQDPSTIGTKGHMDNPILMGQRRPNSLPEAASQSLAVLSALPVKIRAPSGLNTAALTSS